MSHPPVGVDPALRDHWFARAMHIAISQNDLPTVQTLHAFHPEPLVLSSLQLAMQHGALEMVQWMIQHRADRLCCPVGIQTVCHSCWLSALRWIGHRDACRIVQWAVEQGLPVSDTSKSPLLVDELRTNVQLLRWMDQRGLLPQKAIHAVLCRALLTRQSNDDRAAGVSCGQVVTYILERKHFDFIQHDMLVNAVMTASCQIEKQDMVSCVLSSPLCNSFRHKIYFAQQQQGDGAKVMRLDDDTSNFVHGVDIQHRLLVCAAQFCHVDALRSQYEELGSEPMRIESIATEQELLHKYTWMQQAGIDGRSSWSTRDMEVAAERGYLAVVQWLHVNRPERCTRRAMDAAARNGHLHVVQWLHENRSEGCTGDALEAAAAHGHLDVVQWLYANRPHFPNHRSTVMLYAALHGELDVLVWLYESDGGEDDVVCTRCVRSALLREPNRYAAGGMCGNESYPVLDTLRWLDAHQSQRGGCSGHCVDEPRLVHEPPCNLTLQAVCRGDIQLLAYLHTHHAAQFAETAEEPTAYVARLLVCGSVRGSEPPTGHFRVAQWLYDHYKAMVDWKLVLAVAEEVKRQDVAEWRALVDGGPV